MTTAATRFAEFEAEARAQGFDEVLERRWAPGTMTDVHEHPFALRAVVVQGEMRLTTGGETIICNRAMSSRSRRRAACGTLRPGGCHLLGRAPDREAVIGALRQPAHRVSARASRCVREALQQQCIADD